MKTFATPLLAILLFGTPFFAGVKAADSEGLDTHQETVTSSEVLNILQKTVTDVSHIEMPREYSAEFIHLWKNMDSDVGWLRSIGEGKEMPKAYRSNLQSINEALKQVAYVKMLSLDKKLAICRSSEKDLGTKAHFAGTNPSAPFQNVTVTVRTLNGTHEESGCDVWYSPAAWDAISGRSERFHKLSSPTENDLPPGYYTMWTERDNQGGTRTPVTVDDQSKKQVIDLAVPQPKP